MSTFHTDNDLGINLHTCLDDGSAGNSAGVVLYAHTQKRKMCKEEGLQETRRPLTCPFLGQS